MAHLQYPDGDLYEHELTPNPLGIGGGTAILTPDSDQEGEANETLWWSDHSSDSFAPTPLCAFGDDLDDDEAYFLEDEDDDDDDIEDDYDDEDDDDDDMLADSDDEDDDEEL